MNTVNLKSQPNIYMLHIINIETNLEVSI